MTILEALGSHPMIFSMPTCGGCRTCEMACSFKRTGEFTPAVSGIKILDKENEPGFIVMLIEENDGQSFVCDGCQGLEVPLCIQYCNKSEDLEKILKEFMEKGTQKRRKGLNP
jgi:Fe-S-cluster-containing hydrogenase component 2